MPDGRKRSSGSRVDEYIDPFVGHDEMTLVTCGVPSRPQFTFSSSNSTLIQRFTNLKMSNTEKDQAASSQAEDDDEPDEWYGLIAALDRSLQLTEDQGQENLQHGLRRSVCPLSRTHGR